MAVAVENAEKDTILQPVLPKPDKPCGNCRYVGARSREGYS